MLKGALLGFGAVAEKAHAPAWKKEEGISILAAADAAPARRAAAQMQFPGIRTYESVEDLLRTEDAIDFVDIATPPHLHAQQCLQALKKGLHVLCEKPLVLSTHDFVRLRDAAQERDRALFTANNWKYAPLFSKLRRLIAQDTIGEIRHIEWHTLRTQPSVVAVVSNGNWRTDTKLSGGGILIDHGWHAFYLMTWLLGAAPRRASGALKYPDTGKGRGPAAEMEATCLLEFPRTSAVVHLTWNAPCRGHWGILHGARGSIDIRDDKLHVNGTRASTVTYSFPEALSHGSAHPEWFHAMLGDFRAAVTDRRRRAVNLSESQHCVALIEQIYRQHAR